MNTIEQTIYNRITDAISQKKMIAFVYKSEKQNNSKVVYVEPYLIGEHVSTKNILLSAYFLPNTGQISLGDKEGWKLYNLTGIKEVVVLDIPVTKIRSTYNPNPIIMGTVLQGICRNS